MYILALQLGHNATVSLYENNSVLEVVSEEKLKTHLSFQKNL